MVKLLKYAFIGFSLYAILIAAPNDKIAMYNGVAAYALAMKQACVARNGPCTFAGRVWKDFTSQQESI